MILQCGARNMSAVREARWPSAGAWALKVNFWYLRAQYLAITDAYLAAIQDMATPQTLSRKGSKGHALHIVAGGIDTSSSEEEKQLPVRNENVASPILCRIV